MKSVTILKLKENCIYKQEKVSWSFKSLITSVVVIFLPISIF